MHILLLKRNKLGFEVLLLLDQSILTGANADVQLRNLLVENTLTGREFILKALNINIVFVLLFNKFTFQKCDLAV